MVLINSSSCPESPKIVTYASITPKRHRKRAKEPIIVPLSAITGGQVEQGKSDNTDAHKQAI